MYKKFFHRINGLIPTYGIFPLLFSLIFNCLVYIGTKWIAGDWYHYNIESRWDLALPFVPQFLIIYFGCYLFWAVNYSMIARQDRQSVYQFFTADFISRCVCLVIYLVFPTTNTRPVIEGYGFWEQATRLLYGIDAPDNLFPSIHCLISWFCYIGIRGRKEVPLWYRGASMFFALLVFVSTLLTKQHVMIDVISGVLLAEGCFLIGKKSNLYKWYEKIGNKMEVYVQKLTDRWFFNEKE